MTVADIVKDIPIVANNPTMYESNLIVHTSNSLTIKISFGQRAEGCPKLLQDISIYL